MNLLATVSRSRTCIIRLNPIYVCVLIDWFNSLTSYDQISSGFGGSFDGE